MSTVEILIVAALTFILAWRQARKQDLLGMIIALVAYFMTLAHFADYRYGSDVVNTGMFTLILLTVSVPVYVYAIKRKQTKAAPKK